MPREDSFSSRTYDHSLEKRCHEEDDSKTRTVTQEVHSEGIPLGEVRQLAFPRWSATVLQALNEVAVAGMFYY